MKKIVVVSASLLLAFSAQAGLYRWVDDAGNIHFSDKVPASASKKAHMKLNKSGDVTGQVDPESKQKALDIKKAAKLEKERLAEVRRIKYQAQAVIQQRDDNLMSTYEDEDELIKFFETKIKMVQGNSKILEAQQKVLKKKVVKLETQATKTKQDASLKQIARKIVNINNTLKQYQQALVENDKQIIKLSNNYHSDLARYKELNKE